MAKKTAEEFDKQIAAQRKTVRSLREQIRRERHSHQTERLVASREQQLLNLEQEEARLRAELEAVKSTPVAAVRPAKTEQELAQEGNAPIGTPGTFVVADGATFTDPLADVPAESNQEKSK